MPDLTLVLPAYNEEARIDPALDELFGYLRRRGGPPREGNPGSSNLPGDIHVLVVDDGSTDATAAIVRARPEAAPGVREAGVGGPWQGAWLEPPVRAPPRQGRRGPGRDAGRRRRAGRLRRRGHGDPAGPAARSSSPRSRPRTIALGSRIQPDGSDMRRTQPGIRRLLGKVFHLLAAAWVSGPVRDTQCGFKGFRAAAAHDLFGRQRITSIVFDVELIYLARRRGYRMTVVPIQWTDRRGSRMQARAGLAIRVAWDLFRIPLIHRGVGRRP